MIQPSIKSCRVLAVDDDSLSLAILDDMLADITDELWQATSGPEALSRVRDEVPDLILLDIMMPEMDGFEVCRRLKQMPELAAVPVIFLTARTQPDDIVRGFEVGAVDYVTKPFNSDELVARVRAQLEIKRQRDTILKMNAQLAREIEERRAYERKQQISIYTAKQLLELVSGCGARHIPLASNLTLFVDVLSVPCNMEGGDHVLMQHDPETRRMFLGLMDQSGHEVQCVLRCIATDLVLQRVLRRLRETGTPPSMSEVAENLNLQLMQTHLFANADFCTALLLDLDQENQVLSYASCGHPPMLLIRDGKVRVLPNAGAMGSNLPLPLEEQRPFMSDSITLRSGDVVLVYSDGLTDLASADDAPAMHTDQLVAEVRSLVEERGGMSASELRRALLERLAALGERTVPSRAFPGPDDMTLVLLEVETVRWGGTVSVCAENEEELATQILNLVETIGQEWEERGFSDADSRLRMVLEEALCNSWKHGRSGTPERPIRVRWRYGNDCVLEVVDQGPGFDPKTVPDCTGYRSRTRTGGRGLHLIRTVTHEACWHDGGRRLTVAFGREPDEGVSLAFL